VDRSEAEAIYDAGREVVVEVLLAMDRRIQQLEARVEKLERQLAKSSRNSSLPPSSDSPGETPRRSKDRSGRKRGGQPGHEGRGRDLLPACAVDEVIEHWPERCGCKYCRGMARNLFKAWPALWTFAAHKGVEPTNNHAERALRGAVIYRKLSLGTQSEQGERRIARLLSAHTTCRLQGRSLFVYLTDALAAHARGDPVPLLA